MIAELLLAVPLGFNDCSDRLDVQQQERLTICVLPRLIGYPNHIRVLEWNAIEAVTEYRIRWSKTGVDWCAQDYEAVGKSSCTGSALPRCYIDAYLVPETPDLLYLAVTEMKNGVEGPIGFGRIVTCPTRERNEIPEYRTWP